VDLASEFLGGGIGDEGSRCTDSAEEGVGADAESPGDVAHRLAHEVAADSQLECVFRDSLVHLAEALLREDAGEEIRGEGIGGAKLFPTRPAGEGEADEPPDAGAKTAWGAHYFFSVKRGLR
jgi:hypothetical protein